MSYIKITHISNLTLFFIIMIQLRLKQILKFKEARKFYNFHLLLLQFERKFELYCTSHLHSAVKFPEQTLLNSRHLYSENAFSIRSTYIFVCF